MKMKGRYKVRIQNNNVRYEFEIRRNITIIQGNSATGKTTLVDLVREYMLSGRESGIAVSCSVSCRVLEGMEWKNQLTYMKESIIFIDEGNRFIESQDFAEAVKTSDNYYVIVTREGLPMLPYSVDEIYGIHSSGKYNSLSPVYHEFYHIYSKEFVNEYIKPDCIITEDSNAGYEFFRAVNDSDTQCISAQGKSNIFDCVEEHKDKENILIIADGAAFGSEMNKLMEMIERSKKIIKLYLPESFEWVILKSDVLNDKEIREILLKPEDYIDSQKYFSWEQFFTRLLMDKSIGTYLQYKKDKLNIGYLEKKNLLKIKQILPDVIDTKE